MHINKVIIHNVIISSNIKQFIKKFSKFKIISLINIQFNYNQVTLTKKNCDITNFIMMLDLLKNCTFI